MRVRDEVSGDEDDTRDEDEFQTKAESTPQS